MVIIMIIIIIMIIMIIMIIIIIIVPARGPKIRCFAYFNSKSKSNSKSNQI